MPRVQMALSLNDTCTVDESMFSLDILSKGQHVKQSNACVITLSNDDSQFYFMHTCARFSSNACVITLSNDDSQFYFMYTCARFSSCHDVFRI